MSAAIAGFRLDRGSVLGDSDEYLVARLRAGDDAAFEAIYDRYASGLLAFCVHLLGSREAAEDALQLTFVSAFRALRRGESNIALRPWLYTIARNRCLSELRTRCDVVDVDGVVVDRPFLEGVADQVERREDLREMLQDMQRLPADQRAALVLFELGDHSHEEIAAVLGVRKEKVKALVFQAREALMRGRRARERPCAEIRERLATLQGTVLARSMARAHIDRCPSCAAFESEVRRQHAALALLLPVALTSQLKASVLGSALRSGYALAATGGMPPVARARGCARRGWRDRRRWRWCARRGWRDRRRWRWCARRGWRNRRRWRWRSRSGQRRRCHWCGQHRRDRWRTVGGGCRHRTHGRWCGLCRLCRGSWPGCNGGPREDPHSSRDRNRWRRCNP